MAHRKINLLHISVIEEAASGDNEAMTAVVQHYHSYMAALGRIYHDADVETQGRMETRLMLAILKFRVKSDTDYP